MTLDEAVRRGRRHFRQVFLPVALPLGFVAGLVPLMQVRWMRGFMRAGPPADVNAFFGEFALFMGGILLFAGVTVLGHTAFLVAAVDAVAGRAVSMGRAWTAMLDPRAFGTLVLNWLAVMLGCCLCLLPGLYVVLLQAMLIPVIVEERRFGPGALARSAELTRYNPRRTLAADPRLQVFLVLFVGFLLNYAVGFAIQLPAMVVQQVMMFRGISAGREMDPVDLMAGLAWIQVPTGVLAAMGQAAVQIYVSFGLALLFFDLKRRKEGADLEAAIEGLAAREAEGRG
jgi:hypothetical protein